MNKPVGQVRRLDHLGRVVVPIELRRELHLPEGAPLEVFRDGDTILLRPRKQVCTFCGDGSSGSLIAHHGKNVCRQCLSSLPCPGAQAN